MRGNRTRNVAPPPGGLSSSTRPCHCRATLATSARPRPVPLPASFVVKNGSKMRARSSRGTPGPVSLTDSAACPSITGGDRDHAAVGHGVARVDHQVERDLLELGPVGPDPTDVVGGGEAELDVVAG